jgi:hypothetical protein
MREDALKGSLREVPVPMPAEAERRGLAVVEAAYADRAGREHDARESRLPSLPRLAVALAAATLLVALLLTPAGAAVREWVDDAITSTPRPQPGLAEIPGGGRLLVQSAEGPWVVQADGSRRLLGDYEEATWSPRGLFVAVAEGRTLSAVEPDGDPRWSIEAPRRVSDPRWSPSGYRISYRAGTRLWVVAGDGTGKRELAAATALVAPAWSPVGVSQLAYVSAEGRLRIADSESGKVLASIPALSGIDQLEWGGGGSSLLEASSRSLRLRTIQSSKLAARPRFGASRSLAVPARERVVDAALSPRRGVVGAVLSRQGPSGPSSSVVIFDPRDNGPRRLLTVPANLGEIDWAPDGRRLLVAWPDADQWLFLPVSRGRGRAVAGVAEAFTPGERAASFPRVEGWCCRR